MLWLVIRRQNRRIKKKVYGLKNEHPGGVGGYHAFRNNRWIDDDIMFSTCRHDRRSILLLLVNGEASQSLRQPRRPLLDWLDVFCVLRSMNCEP